MEVWKRSTLWLRLAEPLTVQFGGRSCIATFGRRDPEPGATSCRFLGVELLPSLHHLLQRVRDDNLFLGYARRLYQRVVEAINFGFDGAASTQVDFIADFS